MISVRYPFHPLVGRRFRPVRKRAGPPPSFTVELPEKLLAIPVWMTEQPAETFQLTETPTITVEALLDIADLIYHALDRQDVARILSMKKNSYEELCHDKRNPTDTSSRMGGTKYSSLRPTQCHPTNSSGNGSADAANSPCRRRTGGEK